MPNIVVLLIPKEPLSFPCRVKGLFHWGRDKWYNTSAFHIAYYWYYFVGREHSIWSSLAKNKLELTKIKPVQLTMCKLQFVGTKCSFRLLHDSFIHRLKMLGLWQSLFKESQFSASTTNTNEAFKLGNVVNFHTHFVLSKRMYQFTVKRNMQRFKKVYPYPLNFKVNSLWVILNSGK